MSKIKLSATIVLVFFFIAAKAQDFQKYRKDRYIKGKDSINYRILFPENFDPSKKYPLVVFLHGSGERGADNEKQLIHGGKLFLTERFRKDFPAIVVFPQCSSDSFWANVEFGSGVSGKRTFNFAKGGKPTKAMRALLGMLEHMKDRPFVDKKMVYIGGLSMGGMGTYELMRRKRRMFAAAFAICGGDDIANVRKYKNTPLWIFHGEKDDVVPVGLSTDIADQLRVLGVTPKITLYPNDNHNSWDSAFAEPELLSWLFSHQR